MDKHVKLKKEPIKLEDLALRCSMPANLIDLVFFRCELSPSEDEISCLLLFGAQTLIKPFKTVASKFLQHSWCRAEF